MSPYTNTQLVPNEKTTPSTESPTVTTTLPPFISNGYFDTKLQAMFTLSDQILIDLIKYLMP